MLIELINRPSHAFKLRLLTLLSLLCLSCKNLPRKVEVGAAQDILRTPESGNQSAFPSEASLKSFQQNIYGTILKPYCGSCHAETFASEQIELAHTQFLNRMPLDNFSETKDVLLVDKLRHNHNCWLDSADLCASAMESAIDLWLADLLKLGFKPSPQVFPIQTAEVSFLKSKEVTIPFDQTQYAAASVEQAVLQAPFVKQALSNDGRIKSYAVAQGGVGPEVANEDFAFLFADRSKAVSFELDVKEPGAYSVWARVSTAKSEMNNFFIMIANRLMNFKTPITGEDTWKWVQLTEKLEDDSLQPVLLEVLAPAKVEVPIVFRSNGAKISYLVLNRKADVFDGDQFVVDFREIRIPLPMQGSFIVATIWEQVTQVKGTKYVGVRDLRIESPRPIRVKGIYPLVNGKFYRNHGAYTQVDTLAGGSSERAKQLIQTGGSLSTTWVADLKVDRLSFAFDLLE